MSRRNGPRPWASGKLKDRAWVPYTVWFHRDLHQEIKRLAFERQVSMQELMLGALKTFVEVVNKNGRG